MYNVFLGHLTKCNSLAGMEQEVSYNEIGKKNHKLIYSIVVMQRKFV
jgi:hypothetical protein